MISTLLLTLNSPLFRFIAIGLVIFGLLFGIYRAGQNDIQADWDADKAKVQKEIDVLKEKANQVTSISEIKYVDRIKVIKRKSEVITKYVDRYITTDTDKNCVIPKNAITIHDAAAKNVTVEELQ